MAKNIFNFDADAYLKVRPDVKAAGVDPYQHYNEWGKGEGMDERVENLFGKVPVASDPSEWKEYLDYRTANPWDGESTNYQPFYQDPNTGNVYKRNENTGKDIWDNPIYTIDDYTLHASGNALGDEYIGGLGLNLDEAEQLYQKSLSDPTGYTKDLINQYADQWYRNWGSNLSTTRADNYLNELKEKDPYTYYENRMENYGREMGWQIGQNESGRNRVTEEAVRNMIPDALQAGLTMDQVQQIVNAGMNQGNRENQQRIANLAASGGGGFNFGKDVLPGLIMVGGSALGMYGLDMALAAGASAGAGGFGLTGASTGTGTFGSINAAAGAGGWGLSAAPTAGTVLGTGLNGGAIGATYLAAAPGQIATNAFGAPILYSGAGDYASLLKNVASSGKDIFDTVDKSKKLGELLQKATGNGAPAGGAGGGGSGSNIAGILNSNLTLDQVEKNLKSRYNPFMAQPIETIVDQDKIKRNTNYGLANLLKAENNG